MCHSVTNNPNIVSNKLNEELSKDRIEGPFLSPPLEHLKISPLALREKKNSLNFRLLHNLSFPYDDTSVNRNIPTDYCTVKYSSISSAVKLIQNTPNCYLAKTDIADAFRLIPLHPTQYHLTGFMFQNKYYYDKCLPQGCSSSCNIFEKFSDSLSWILSYHYDVNTIVKVLDDFLFIGNGHSETLRQLNHFRTMCKDVGVPIAEHKTEDPVKCLTFLGLEIDTARMETMLSIIGKLQFSTCVVTVGKCFLRRLYDATIGISKPFHYLRLSADMKQDLTIWATFLQHYNGISFISEKDTFTSSDNHIYSDSSSIGYGATFSDEYIYGSFPTNWKDFSIEVLELYPIFLILNIFAPKLSRKRVIFHCDNMAIVHILNKQTSRCKIIMKLVRPFVLTMLKYDISFKAVHVPGKNNVLCDALSRLQFTKDLLLEHGMKERPTHVPNHLRPCNLKMT